MQVCIQFSHVSFTYPENSKPVFRELDVDLQSGCTSLIGQNGTGKSTFLLLAGGRLLPQKGSVQIRGIDTKTIQDESQKNQLASFIYQNMEFETEESIHELLYFVYEQGKHNGSNEALIRELIKVLDLENELEKTTGQLSKGALQRSILAFSILYGSDILLMDEPVFALEDRQKSAALEYLNYYAKQYEKSLFYSIHELDLSRKYSERVLCFYKDGNVQHGVTQELMTRGNLEKLFNAPYDTLHDRDMLYREGLLSQYSEE